MKKCKIYPVIHHDNVGMTMENVEKAVKVGCDGVFLIHMNGEDKTLSPVCVAIKQKYNNLFVGINRLASQDENCIFDNLLCGADATWVDNCGILNGKSNDRTKALSEALRNSNGHKLFGAVAFKYQSLDYYPQQSAALALSFGFIPTTSGVGTGHAPEVQKIAMMSHATDRINLAIASGITPDNISSFIPFCDNFLVSTGISKSFYEFDLQLMESLVENASK